MWHLGLETPSIGLLNWELYVAPWIIETPSIGLLNWELYMAPWNIGLLLNTLYRTL